MSSEVCPFCGKSFKRLKSHLPHCKAAASHKSPLSHHEETETSPAVLSSQTAKSKSTSRGEKPMQKADTKGKKVVKSSTTSQPTKKTKLKLSKQIKMAIAASSPLSPCSPSSSLSPHLQSLPSSPPSPSSQSSPLSLSLLPLPSSPPMPSSPLSPPLSPLPSSSTLKSKIKNQAPNQISTGSTDKMVLSAAKLQVAKSPLKSQTKYDNSYNTPIAKKTSKKKSISANKICSNEAIVRINNIKSNSRDNSWLEDEARHENLREHDLAGRETKKITLTDLRTTLGRAKQNGRQRSIVEKIEELKCENTKNYHLVKAVSVQQVVPSQVMAAKLEKSEVILSKNNDFLSKLSKTENKDCVFTQRANSLKDGLKMDHHSMGLVALASPKRAFFEAEISTRKDLLPLLKQNVERLGNEGRMDVRRTNPEEAGTRGIPRQQRLGQVTLRELPHWLVSRSPRRPRDVLGMAQKGWQWYYSRYINVKRGGVGGVAMLLAGYCVLSYVWTYPHLKRDRWRKYH